MISKALRKSRTCKHYGREFVPGAKNAKYCSGACAYKGHAMRRRAWELRSGYLQKQRERAQKRRDAIRAAAEEERAAAARIEAEARERSQIEGHWSAWRDYGLHFAEASGKISKSTVNEICVTESDFAHLVVESIRQDGKITAMVNHE